MTRRFDCTSRHAIMLLYIVVVYLSLLCYHDYHHRHHWWCFGINIIIFSIFMDFTIIKPRHSHHLALQLATFSSDLNRPFIHKQQPPSHTTTIITHNDHHHTQQPLQGKWYRFSSEEVGLIAAAQMLGPLRVLSTKAGRELDDTVASYLLKGNLSIIVQAARGLGIKHSKRVYAARLMGSEFVMFVCCCVCMHRRQMSVITYHITCFTLTHFLLTSFPLLALFLPLPSVCYLSSIPPTRLALWRACTHGKQQNHGHACTHRFCEVSVEDTKSTAVGKYGPRGARADATPYDAFDDTHASVTFSHFFEVRPSACQ